MTFFITTKNITFAFILFCSMTVFGQDITLMSYNVGSNNWSITKDSVITRITANDPDIFCAIEAGQSKRPFIESELTNYRMIETFGTSPSNSDSHIFLRKNMFDVVDSGFVQMETYVGYTGMGRYINWARLEETSSGNQFLVYASHFVANVGANADSAVIAQYRHADGMIQLLSQHTSLNIPMITVGDFNASVASDVMQFLLEQTPITYNSTTITNPIELDDSWDIANPGIPKPPTVSSGQSKIDWIVVSVDTDVTLAIIDDQGVNGNGIPPSDHLPLMIGFDFLDFTSLNEMSTNSTIEVYPNPFKNSVSFELNSEVSGPLVVTIVNSIGQVVKQVELFDNSIKNVTLNLPDLQDGLYFAHIVAPNMNQVIQLLKKN